MTDEEAITLATRAGLLRHKGPATSIAQVLATRKIPFDLKPAWQAAEALGMESIEGENLRFPGTTTHSLYVHQLQILLEVPREDIPLLLAHNQSDLYPNAKRFLEARLEGRIP